MIQKVKDGEFFDGKLFKDEPKKSTVKIVPKSQQKTKCYAWGDDGKCSVW